MFFLTAFSVRIKYGIIKKSIVLNKKLFKSKKMK